jgi:hypothetical protein
MGPPLVLRMLASTISALFQEDQSGSPITVLVRF